MLTDGNMISVWKQVVKNNHPASNIASIILLLCDAHTNAESSEADLLYEAVH